MQTLQIATIIILKYYLWFLRQVAASSDKVDFLPLNFRPEDPYSHPIFGDKITSSNLLLKVTRDKTTKQFDAEVVGLIPTTFRFRGMADFQYMVPRYVFTEEKIEPNSMYFITSLLRAYFCFRAKWRAASRRQEWTYSFTATNVLAHGRTLQLQVRMYYMYYNYNTYLLQLCSQSSVQSWRGHWRKQGTCSSN